MKAMIELIKETFSEWSEDHAPRLAAALSYYAIFSLAPLLVIIIALAGLIGGRDAVQNQVMGQIQDLVGEQGREFVQSMVASASQPSTGIIATFLGVITLLIGALGVFGVLQDSLNTIWEVKPKPSQGLWDTIKRLIFGRFLSFAMLLVIGLLLLISLVVSAGLAAFGNYLGSLWSIPPMLLQIINFVVSLGVIALLFAMIFKFLPDADIAWRDVWLGAFVTAFLFALGKFAIGLYLGQSNVGTTFGAAGSLAILLVWIYYTAQIVFLGAEFTQVYANKFGSRIVPEEDAVKITEGERAEQGIPHQETLADKSPVPAYPQGASPSWYRTQLTSASIRGRRRNLSDKIFYNLLMATQFVPSLRRKYAAKTEPTEGTETASGTRPAARS
jgi:membrane protein